MHKTNNNLSCQSYLPYWNNLRLEVSSTSSPVYGSFKCVTDDARGIVLYTCVVDI